MTRLFDAAIIRQAVRDNAIKFLPNHKCGICQVPVGWYINGDRVHYISACDCTSGDTGTQSSFTDIARHLDNQKDDATRVKIMREWFGAEYMRRFAA